MTTEGQVYLSFVAVGALMVFLIVYEVWRRKTHIGGITLTRDTTTSDGNITPKDKCKVVLLAATLTIVAYFAKVLLKKALTSGQWNMWEDEIISGLAAVVIILATKYYRYRQWK